MSLDPAHAYRVLGLVPGASAEEVKSAYRDLVQVWHPDRFPEKSRLRDKAERNLQRINEAYAVLKDYTPPPGPPPSRLRASIAAILGMGDLRGSRALAAPARALRRSLHVLGLTAAPDEPRSRLALWIAAGLAALLAAIAAVALLL